jgi:hypothetical protein
MAMNEKVLLARYEKQTNKFWKASVFEKRSKTEIIYATEEFAQRHVARKWARDKIRKLKRED